ncbi:hypothetical protein TI01_1429 [Lysobacter sp. A03]|nr:hypothetical protein TI01_1429 [Lysobacter sp. A03]
MPQLGTSCGQLTNLADGQILSTACAQSGTTLYRACNIDKPVLRQWVGRLLPRFRLLHHHQAFDLYISLYWSLRACKSPDWTHLPSPILELELDGKRPARQCTSPIVLPKPRNQHICGYRGHKLWATATGRYHRQVAHNLSLLHDASCTGVLVDVKRR